MGIDSFMKIDFLILFELVNLLCFINGSLHVLSYLFHEESFLVLFLFEDISDKEGLLFNKAFGSIAGTVVPVFFKILAYFHV